LTTEQQPIDLAKTAILIMDFQNDIVSGVAEDSPAVVSNAARVLEGARGRGVPIIHVMHRGGRFTEPSPGAEIHPGVQPAAGESVISKTKAGPFSTTGLDVSLREMGVDTLALMGVSTSGCVLSASRWAGDLGYRVVVITDACADRDPEVHRVLTEKIYVRQGVMTTDEVLASLS
jgi:nicotinamidase-related amidase